MAFMCPSVFILHLKMMTKTKWLVLLLATVFTVSGKDFTPFDIVDNYVTDFQTKTEKMSKLSEEYRFEQKEYDSLEQDVAKLLISKDSIFSYYLNVFILIKYFLSNSLDLYYDS